MVGFLSLLLHWIFLASTAGAFAVGLLLCLASDSWGPSWGCSSLVKSEKWHHIYQGSVYFPWFCLAAAKIWSNGQTSVIAQFYLESKGKYMLKAWEWADPKEKQALGSILAPLFICFFLLPLSLTYINWASQESCLFYLRFSLQSSDLPLFYFCGLFPSLSFSHHHSWLLFPILAT